MTHFPTHTITLTIPVPIPGMPVPAHHLAALIQKAVKDGRFTVQQIEPIGTVDPVWPTMAAWFAERVAPRDMPGTYGEALALLTSPALAAHDTPEVATFRQHLEALYAQEYAAIHADVKWAVVERRGQAWWDALGGDTADIFALGEIRIQADIEARQGVTHRLWAFREYWKKWKD